jgi:pyridoxal phosphate enzyme (YggS family)
LVEKRWVENSVSVQHNLQHIQEKIVQACTRSHRNPNDVNIIAVTKYVSIETAQAAVDAGVSHLGENRDDGFLNKYKNLEGDITWHFIGSLQSRKVKAVINEVDYLHSLDRLSLAKEIQKRAAKKIRCFVQVNVYGEATKHGIDPEEVVSFIHKLIDYPAIEVVGLMTMAPHIEDETKLREIFKTLKVIKQEVQALELSYAPCKELSMGMSNDFHIAIEEGATFVRVGTALVGKEF